MEYSLDSKGPHTLVSIDTCIDIYNAAEVKRILFEIIAQKHQSLIFDMKSVDFTDSSAVSVIVASQRESEEHGTSFALVNVPDNFIDILRLATLDEYFTIYKNYSFLPKEL